ncbi:MAG: riboflavin synthase [Actinomycetales bacterium]|nr:riboflavin synthase [Actinomycetales bacterium]
MFTGIVEELGRVEEIAHGEDSARLTIRGPVVTTDAAHGDSIAVNGVCLTVTTVEGDTFTVDVMAQTLALTGIGDLRPGDRVNLERAMAADGRFGGHIVQGHVDATATVVSRTPGDRWETVRFTLPPALARYLVPQGSITVDGVSLTVASLEDDTFTVSLIPTTLELTTLGLRQPGERVNLEVDVLAKYVERMLAARTGQMPSATEEPKVIS